MKKLAVMGFGNPVRGDDAIGCVVVNRLKQEFAHYAKGNISFFDMGTSGFEVIFALKGHSKIIVIDAVLESEEALGKIYKVPAEEVLKAPEDDPLLFLHGMKWNQGLSYAKKILADEYPQDISAYLVGIRNTSMVEAMNPEVEQAGEQLCQIIKAEIEQWLD